MPATARNCGGGEDRSQSQRDKPYFAFFEEIFSQIDKIASRI